MDFAMLPPPKIWQSFQHKLAEVLEELGYIPSMILVNSNSGLNFMCPYEDALGIEVVYAPDHPLFHDLLVSMKDDFK